MPSKGKKKKTRSLTCDRIQSSSDKATNPGFVKCDIHSILANTGEYSDTSSDDDGRSQSSTPESDDDEYASPNPEHFNGDGDVDGDGDGDGDYDGDFLPAKDKHNNKRKKVLSQSDNNSKKSKINSSEIISETTSMATTSQQDKISTENVSHVAYLRGKIRKLTGCNPFFISKEIEKSFGKVAQVESRGFSLKLTCTSQKQKESVVNCKLLGDIEVVGSIPNVETRKQQNAEHAKVHRVVITGVPVDVEDGVVKEETNAIEAKRIYKRYDSGTTPTTAVILTFEVENIPSTVTIGYLRFKTKNYIPMVTRCYKCQKFGHTASRCRQESDTCPICSGQHTYNECSVKENTETKKCANCGEAHSASYRGCKEYVLAKQVIHRAAESRLSYRDALIQIKKEKRAMKQPEGSSATISNPVASTSGGLTSDSTLTASFQPQISQASTRSMRSHAQVQIMDTTTISTMSETKKKSIGTQCGPQEEGTTEMMTERNTTDDMEQQPTESTIETLSGNELYVLLAMFIKLSEERMSKTSLTKSIAKYVSSIVNRPTEAIYQNIRHCYEIGNTKDKNLDKPAEDRSSSLKMTSAS